MISLNTVSVLMFDGGDVVSRGVGVNSLVRGWVRKGRQVLFSSLMIGLRGGGGGF